MLPLVSVRAPNQDLHPTAKIHRGKWLVPMASPAETPLGQLLFFGQAFQLVSQRTDQQPGIGTPANRSLIPSRIEK